MRSTLKYLRDRRNNSEGFTLIELLVVVVIIGVLIAIAIPLYLNYQKSSHDKAADSDVRNAVVVMEQCFADNGTYPSPGAITASTDLSTLTSGAKCQGVINLSPASDLTITADDTTTPPSYTICGYNTDGHASTYYHYSSATGGSVQSNATAC